MKKCFKLISILALFLLLIGCSSTENNGESEFKYIKQREQTKEDALREYLSKGILTEYTENEMLTEMYISLHSEVESLAQILRELDFKYENLDEFVKFIKSQSDYKSERARVMEKGYTEEETETILESLTALALLYNEYDDKGVRLEKEIGVIIRKDERVKQHIKDMVIVGRALASKKEEFQQ